MASRQFLKKFDRLSDSAQHHLEEQADRLLNMGGPHIRRALPVPGHPVKAGWTPMLVSSPEWIEREREEAERWRRFALWSRRPAKEILPAILEALEAQQRRSR